MSIGFINMDTIDGPHKSSFGRGRVRTDALLEWASGKRIKEKQAIYLEKFCCQEKRIGCSNMEIN